MGDVSSVGMEMLGGHGSYFGRAGMERAQVPVRDRGLPGIDCLDNQFVKGIVSSGERRGGQKPRELGNHLLQREVAGPHAQIGVIGHNHRIFGLYRGQSELANRCGVARCAAGLETGRGASFPYRRLSHAEKEVRSAA